MLRYMLIEDVISFLKTIPPFQFLSDKSLQSLASSLSMQFYPKDTVILKQGALPSDALMIIKKGGVKISVKSEDGEDVTIDYRGEGDNFGFLSVIGGDRQKTTVVAVEDTICYSLGREKVLKLLEANPDLTEYFLKSHFAKYIHRTYREMQGKSLFYGSSDHLLFTTQIGDIAVRDVVTVNEKTTIQEAAGTMAANRISSLIIVDDKNLPVGIITDRDLRIKVIAKGRDITESVRNIMSLPLIRVDAKDYCFEAVLKMIKHNIHHILVIKEGNLKGVITNHDLMLLQGSSPLSFAKDIESQQTIDSLVNVSGKINRVIGLLLKEGAKASNIAKIIAELNDRLSKKILEIAEKKFGKPPVPYCWIVFGSEGRKEQTFKTDQDNALIYADVPDEVNTEGVQKYFSDFSVFVRDSLVRCGFPLCPADYMASNPQWRQPLKVWKGYFHKWISTPTPEALLKSLIFFDFRPLYGDFSLAEQLRNYLLRILKDQNIFLALMAGAITASKPPLGFFNRFIVEKSGEHKNELNLKIRGIGPIVDIVRFFSLESGIAETSTLERIKALQESHPVVETMGEELEQAFEFINLLRIHHQVDQIEKGINPDNFINPENMSNLEKKSLKEAFHTISKAQDIIIDQYRQGIVRG